MEPVRKDLGHVGHYEQGETPERASMRLLLWLFALGLLVLAAVRYVSAS